MAVTPKKAATLVILRHFQGEVQVFMQKRALEASFVGGAHVFPGGKMERDDEFFPDALIAYPEKENGESLFKGFGGKASVIAALRECFEEAGILLAYDKQGAMLAFDEAKERSHFDNLRISLNAEQTTFEKLCRENELLLALDQIALIGHWITPESSPQRFDTRFFVCMAPSFQEGIHDNYESIDSVWISPEDALQQERDGEMKLIYPTIKTLEFLSDFTSVDDIMSECYANGHTLGEG